MWIYFVLFCALTFQACLSLSTSHHSLDKALKPRTKISGFGRTRGPLIDGGRCTNREQDVIKQALRGISEWSKRAMNTTPRRERDFERVPEEDRLIYENYFGPAEERARDQVHQRFLYLKGEADSSPGRPLYRFHRSVVTIECDHYRGSEYCPNADDLSSIRLITFRSVILVCALISLCV